jgi:hypothetical protein
LPGPLGPDAGHRPLYLRGDMTPGGGRCCADDDYASGVPHHQAGDLKEMPAGEGRIAVSQARSGPIGEAQTPGAGQCRDVTVPLLAVVVHAEHGPILEGLIPPLGGQIQITGQPSAVIEQNRASGPRIAVRTLPARRKAHGRAVRDSGHRPTRRDRARAHPAEPGPRLSGARRARRRGA